MTGYAWVFLGAWILTIIVLTGYWFENQYLKTTLDKFIDAFMRAMEDDSDDE